MTENVRQFTQSPASKILATRGPFAGPEARTIAVYIKVEGEGKGNIFNIVNLSNEERVFFPQISISGFLPVAYQREPLEPATHKLPENTWCLLVITKAKGNAVPRFHVYNFATKKWLFHINAESAGQEEGSVGEGANNWHHLRICGLSGATGPLKAQLAAIGVWNANFSDAEVEKLQAASVDAWKALSPAPNSLVYFNQALVSEAIKDQVGTIEQTSREETSVVNAEPLPMPIAAAAKMVKILVGGVIKEAKRWILIQGELVSK